MEPELLGEMTNSRNRMKKSESKEELKKIMVAYQKYIGASSNMLPLAKSEII
jgi:hypothetical protein